MCSLTLASRVSVFCFFFFFLVFWDVVPFNACLAYKKNHRLLLSFLNDNQIKFPNMESSLQTLAAVVDLPTTCLSYRYVFYGSCRGSMLVVCRDKKGKNNGHVWNPFISSQKINS